MQKRQIFFNSIMSVFQVLVLGGILFVLYRYLLDRLGIEKLGVWSLVLATTSVANMANLGLSASVVKFVAKYLARREIEIVSSVIQTAAVSIGIFIGACLLIVYPFTQWILGILIRTGEIKDALSILPYALLSLWITVISSVFQSGLEGYQRIDLKSILVIVSSLFFLVLCYGMVPAYGLKGLAYAQVIQAFLMLIGCWTALKRLCPGLPWIPFRWNRRVFKEMVGYGISFQIISVSQMLYDPVTKALLTKFGGLSVTGFYEMASRLIMQLRALIVNANQVLVPAIADIQEKKPESIGNLYKRNYGLILYIAVPFYSAIISLTPIISEVWIGYHENMFVFSLILLSMGWFVNTLTAPSYFTYLGTGELFWNMISHVLIALLNIAAGLLLGSLYGAKGVIVAWVISLTVGSFLIILSYHAKEDIHMSFLLPKEYSSVGCSCIIGIVLSRYVYFEIVNKLHLAVTAAIMICAFALVVFFPIWLHPMRNYLIGWARRELSNKSV